MCGSGQIMGEPFVSGSHHILSRGSHSELRLDIRNLALLCVKCHSADANTEPRIRALFKILKERHNYDYSQVPYRYYLED